MIKAFFLKIKSTHSLTVLFFLTIFSFNCLQVNGQELIQDRDFQQGFYVRNRITLVYEGPITCDSTLSAPVWNVAEWSSQSSVLDITPVVLGNGMCQWANANKDFRFGPIGADEYQLYFAVNSLSEYDSVYRLLGEPWPHLLIEQRLSPPYDFAGQGPGCPPFSDLDSLVFQIDAKLFYNQTIMNTGYDPGIHAAQFLIYFVVQNSNTASAGYGKYVWLGVPLYDDRTALPSGNVSYDIGTQTLINTIPYTDFANVSMHNGSWVHASINLLPYAFAALDTAWAHGFLNESTDISDYKVNGINMGWELPGMNISTVGVKNISLFAYSPTTDISNTNEKAYTLEIYPNPATDLFTLNITNKNNVPMTMNIYNVIGMLVRSEKLKQNQQLINTDNFCNGIYIVEVKSNDWSEKQKLIIQK